MVHCYKNNGYNIVMDINSGSVHVVDDIVYDLVPLLEPAVREKKTEAEALKAEYEKKIKSANEESEEILKCASRKALLREEEIIKEANEKAKRTLERANEEIEREKINAINEVKDEVSSIAIDIASSIIGREISKEENEAMIDEFIANMGESK